MSKSNFIVFVAASKNLLLKSTTVFQTELVSIDGVAPEDKIVKSEGEKAAPVKAKTEAEEPKEAENPGDKKKDEL